MKNCLSQRTLGLALLVALAAGRSPARAQVVHTATNAAVRVTEDFQTWPLQSNALRWSSGRGAHRPGYFSFWRNSHEEGRVTLRVLSLENEYLKVEVVPEAGGAVAGVVHKPSGRDLFYREDAVKTRIPFWESGVKASFPYPEHGIRVDQPAAWRILSSTNGPTGIALWMEFSRHAGPDQRSMFGRYTPLTLSQFVSLPPATARVDIRYRIANPCLYKLGRRVWNDAIFPRWEQGRHTARATNPPVGPDDARWIYPVAWASDHSGAKLRRVTPAMLHLAGNGTSLFAWDRAFGFDGLYYPSSDVNRLRLSDPAEAPGAKLWWPNLKPAASNQIPRSTDNIAEIWGGLDSVFEGVEHWLEPGETAEMTLSYALAADIGEVQYADRSCAIGRRTGPAGDTWSAIAFRPAADAVFQVGDHRTHGPCGPQKALSVSLPASSSNLVTVLTLPDRAVTNVFPLVIPAGTNQHDRIRQANAGPDTAERMGHAFDRGMNWASALGSAPRPSIKRARLLCLKGQLGEAAAELKQALVTTPQDGEGWHLLGAIALEKGRPAEAAPLFAKALAAAEPYPSALLGMALASLAQEDRPTATQKLDALIAQRPGNYLARSLRAWIAVAEREPDRQALLDALVAEDPADPRVAWLHLLDDNTDHHQEIVSRLLLEPGAAARLTEFHALTQGQYRHPARPVLW